MRVVKCVQSAGMQVQACLTQSSQGCHRLYQQTSLMTRLRQTRSFRPSCWAALPQHLQLWRVRQGPLRTSRELSQPAATCTLCRHALKSEGQQLSAGLRSSCTDARCFLATHRESCIATCPPWWPGTVHESSTHAIVHYYACQTVEFGMSKVEIAATQGKEKMSQLHLRCESHSHSTLQIFDIALRRDSTFDNLTE